MATLIRILTEKGFLKQTTEERPFGYRAVRSYEDVSRRLLSDLVDRVFQRLARAIARAADGTQKTFRQGTGPAGTNSAGEPIMNALGLHCCVAGAASERVLPGEESASISLPAAATRPPAPGRPPPH